MVGLEIQMVKRTRPRINAELADFFSHGADLE